MSALHSTDWIDRSYFPVIGLPGLVHILIGCFNSFSKYAKLRELQNRDRA